MSAWPSKFLDALLELDAAEGPHGLYGVQQAHVLPSGRLPTLAQMLVSLRHAEPLAKFKLEGSGSPSHPNRLYLSSDGSPPVEMRVLNHAATKVRPFGSAYRLDTRHGKPEAAPAWNLEKLVPKLTVVERQPCRDSPRAILLVAHAPTDKSLHALLGRAAAEDFLRRYAVSLTAREGQDRYKRDFSSGLYLWTRQPAAQAT